MKSAGATSVVRLRFKHDLAACMPLLELSIGIANVGQRIDLRDGDLKAAGGQQPGELREHVHTRSVVAPFRLHAIFSRGGEVDDRVDAIRSNAQLERKLDVPASE